MAPISLHLVVLVMAISTTTTTSTSPTPKTTLLQPEQCQSAINLTESWRKDISDSDILPINRFYNCDLRVMTAAGKPWFRFSGAAGNRLLDHCVATSNCGTYVPIWSDDTMPDQIGLVTSIQAYTSFWGDCKDPDDTDDIDCQVIRCSDEPNDYVYRLADDYNVCPYGFCGMD